MDNKKHWENIYQKKEIDGVSWYQKVPTESLQLIKKYSISNSDKIIDIGCGKSFLADNLLELNYSDISLVDISSNALKEVKDRLQNKSLNFIETDILNFKNNNDPLSIVTSSLNYQPQFIINFFLSKLLAEQGLKVLLVDCNLRQTFNCKNGRVCWIKELLLESRSKIQNMFQMELI